MQANPGAGGRRGVDAPGLMLGDLVRVFAFDVVRAMAVLLILGYPCIVALCSGCWDVRVGPNVMTRFVQCH